MDWFLSRPVARLSPTFPSPSFWVFSSLFTWIPRCMPLFWWNILVSSFLRNSVWNIHVRPCTSERVYILHSKLTSGLMVWRLILCVHLIGPRSAQIFGQTSSWVCLWRFFWTTLTLEGVHWGKQTVLSGWMDLIQLITDLNRITRLSKRAPPACLSVELGNWSFPDFRLGLRDWLFWVSSLPTTDLGTS